MTYDIYTYEIASSPKATHPTYPGSAWRPAIAPSELSMSTVLKLVLARVTADRVSDTRC